MSDTPRNDENIRESGQENGSQSQFRDTIGNKEAYRQSGSEEEWEQGSQSGYEEEKDPQQGYTGGSYQQSFQGNPGDYIQGFQGNQGDYSQGFQGNPGGYGAGFQGNMGGYGQNFQGNMGGYGQNFQGNPAGYGQNFQGNPGGYGQNFQGNPAGYGQNFQGNPGGRQTNFQGKPGNYGPGYGPQGGRQQNYQGNYGKPPKKKKRRKVLFIVEIVVLLILALGLFLFVQMGRIDRVKLKNILVNEGAGSQNGYQNIVVYGVDSRQDQLTKDSHSDTIVICSINKKTKEIKMVSVYRDTYLDNTNGEYRKATECYYFGGPERSINMLNTNLDLDITDYVAVNFNAVVEAVDRLGGIELEITEEELKWLNGYQYDQVENSQVQAEYEPLPAAGYQHLNGNQALAYSRIRYTEGYDFKRTERQRTVMMKIFEKAQAQGVPALLSMIDAMLPMVSTSLSNTELISLASGIAGYSIGENAGFPFNQYATQVDGSDVVVPVNLAANVTELHRFLFGEENYTPSQKVQEISNTIINYTGIQ